MVMHQDQLYCHFYRGQLQHLAGGDYGTVDRSKAYQLYVQNAVVIRQSDTPEILFVAASPVSAPLIWGREVV